MDHIGSMIYQSLMKLKEAAAYAWLDIMSAAERLVTSQRKLRVGKLMIIVAEFR